MSFTIDFMYNTDPINKISKTPSTVYSLTGTLRDECNVTDPVIVIESANPISANYAYISEFSRYYFIRDFKQVRTGIWEITMHCDVLKTFSQGILGSPCIVSKNSDRFNLKINDSDYKCAQNDLIMIQTFPNGFNLNNARFILNLLGDKTTNY